ncbi:pentatricopeptide repeat-containing protein At4g32430, mitochondrial-like [Chenopodium quinoa]|uniref:pentatricopeptide repeat-containing protein At4g32430, mitochondrial-like n=1 Tax=Chenopodium quinoa TaxID=63459 RepID=UPI000B78006A|nr:pentatricopeptide repeat-containing protein At4g32430, mitochondrial-like [Chenopodium quinoa]
MLARQLFFKTHLTSTPQWLLCVGKYYSINHHAHHVFDKSPQRNSTSISNYMLTCIRQNLGYRALNVFNAELQNNYLNGIDEDAVAIAFKACRGDPKAGAMLHSFAVSSGFIQYRSVSNSLMSFYCKSGQFDRALCIFSSMNDPDTVSYNTVLLGFQNTDDALCFAADMNAKGVVFDPVTYTTSLSFCLDDKGFLFGFQLHTNIVKSGFKCEVFIGNALITLYSRWGRIIEAERVFHEMPTKDSVSWNAILCGYSQDGRYGLEMICTFCAMLRDNVRPDNVSITAAISVCGYDRLLEMGRLLHGLSIKAGYGAHCAVCNILMSTYTKCEENEDAKLVFQTMSERNVVSWTTMISVFQEHALSLFHDMRIDEVYPNEVTFIGLLHAITHGDLFNEGRMIHGFCLKTGFVSKLNVSNSLITMYAKFESMGDSQKVFEELQCRDTVSWNTLISGYDQNKMYQEALEVFCSALSETLPNEYTFGSVLSAIGSAEAISLRHGQASHSHLLKLGLNSDAIVSAALLDMYGKRGSLYESKRIFRETVQRTQFAWTAIISAHARHGDYDSVMQIFNEMGNQGVKSDSITFLSMLTACGRKGMVDMGQQIWDLMIKDSVIELSAEHYSCMVDMLGRSGRLKEAEELLHQIPEGPSFSALQSLLGSCRTHGDIEMGQRMANALIEMEPTESGSYVLMSNLYALNGDWEKVAILRRKMRDSRVKKEVGLSWADVGNTDGSLSMHGFSSDDTSHPRSEEICYMAGWLGLEMKVFEKDEELL